MNDTPQLVMREFGFTWEAICQCTPSNRKISAAELFERLCDIESEITCTDETYGVKSDLTDNNKPSSYHHQLLVSEALDLKAKWYCVICHQKLREILIFPCTHFVLCETCMSTYCPICESLIEDYVKVYT